MRSCRSVAIVVLSVVLMSWRRRASQGSTTRWHGRDESGGVASRRPP